MLELHNRPRTIRVTMRSREGVVQNIVQIRKDNLEYQGEIETTDPESLAELESIVDALRQRRKSHKDAVLIRLIETLSEAVQHFGESEDEMERRLISHFIENAFRQIRKSERKPRPEAVTGKE